MVRWWCKCDARSPSELCLGLAVLVKQHRVALQEMTRGRMLEIGNGQDCLVSNSPLVCTTVGSLPELLVHGGEWQEGTSWAGGSGGGEGGHCSGMHVVCKLFYFHLVRSAQRRCGSQVMVHGWLKTFTCGHAGTLSMSRVSRPHLLPWAAVCPKIQGGGGDALPVMKSWK